jgi:hypothetical protein
MTRGKPWVTEEEKQLRALVGKGKSIPEIAGELKKSPEAVRAKINRLGLVVVKHNFSGSCSSTSNAVLPHELISMEEALKMQVGAMKLACTPGLSNVEIQRLQVLATLSKNYIKMLPVFLEVRELEKRLFELEGKFAESGKKAESDGSSN